MQNKFLIFAWGMLAWLRRRLKKIVLLFPILIAVQSGCASAPPVVPQCPRLAPPPSELMQERKPNYRQRLGQDFTILPPTPTKPPAS